MGFFQNIIRIKDFEKNCIPTRVKLSSLKPLQAGIR